MEKNSFESMQMNINEANSVALKNISSKLEKLENIFDSFVADFVEHCNEEDDDDGKSFKDNPIKISGTSRWKI